MFLGRALAALVLCLGTVAPAAPAVLSLPSRPSLSESDAIIGCFRPGQVFTRGLIVALLRYENKILFLYAERNGTYSPPAVYPVVNRFLDGYDRSVLVAEYRTYARFESLRIALPWGTAEQRVGEWYGNPVFQAFSRCRSLENLRPETLDEWLRPV
jgi:hypothetical protein